MNAYTKLSHDFAALARNLSAIERERQDRNRRVAERRQEALRENLRRHRLNHIQNAFWWVSPASWAILFVAGFFLTDWLLERLDGLLALIGL